MSKEYDVVIAGGAMAGATLAMALDSSTNHALKIAVVEPYAQGNAAHPGFDARSIALSYGSVELLKRYDLWRLIEDHATPITHIHVSDRGHAGMTDFHADKEGLDAMGYVVELAEVGQRFSDELANRSNIDFFCPSAVTHLVQQQDKVVIDLTSDDGDQQLQAKLVVAADGADSAICQAVGLNQEIRDFNQVAVIANVLTSEAPNGRAFERFTEHGPLALLPMSQSRSSLVWCLPPEEAADVQSLSESAFVEKLQQAFGWRLGRFTRVGSVVSYPLLLKHRPQIVSHRVAAVGNAAQTLHPIAGQGFNLGIRDIATLVDSLLENLIDVGEYANLTRFQAQRQSDRELTITMTSGLVHVFSNDLLTIRVARNLGLAMMDNFPRLKTPVFNRALGVVKR
ncbi:2-octaprenyl-6-methoxyphenol hydroxylase [Vibrio maritimus]|uniref:2-octaprenyl-6-methoxyphenol hydroxylase n=1 Tax=Vibrio maritimus TaxID=990268 RepID=A0A090RYR4_9VIBR|nr:2-octaprenyl-6-methoxyphenol hydroxylase [Vibrio maritimus]